MVTSFHGVRRLPTMATAVEGRAPCEFAAELARYPDAAKREVCGDVFGRFQAHDVLFHLDRQVAVLTDEPAASQQAQPLVVPGHSRNAVVNQLLQIGSLPAFQ